MPAEPAPHTGRVLLVDDDPAAAERFATALRAQGYTVALATDSLQGLVAVEAWMPALVVLDWALPFIPGRIFLSSLRVGLDEPPPVLVLDGTNPSEALVAGASAVVAPTADPALVVQTVQTMLMPEGG